MQSLHRYKRVLPLVLLFPLIPYLLGSGCAPPPGTDPGTNNPPPPDNGNNNPPAGATNAPPHPVFSFPGSGAVFSVGDVITITFNANDPENDFTYELFYDQD